MDTLLRGVAIGCAIAAPIGPIGVLCIRRTLANGTRTGIVSGVGAALADAVYALVAGGALALATRLVAQLAVPLHVAGGVALIALGVRTLRERGGDGARASATPRDLIVACASTFGLTLVNPATIVSFAGIVAGALGGALASPAAVVTFAGGVFAGSTLWWIVLCGIVGRLRGIGRRTTLVVRLASGSLLIVFGIGALVTIVQR
jgi:threonine/homoserine/homoserine lactone efflux protein